MAKIFDVQDWLKNHPNRNNFDLTHKVHGSYQMGKLYPVLCKPVVPTDSFRIDTAVSLRFTPMPFPTQSNMRVIFHYFYVRNKNIWKNFPNWLQGLESHTPPYINQDKSFFKDGSLADHLGIQTSFLAHGTAQTLSGGFRYGVSSLYATSPAPTIPTAEKVVADILEFPVGFPITNILTNVTADDADSTVYLPLYITGAPSSRSPHIFDRPITKFRTPDILWNLTYNPSWYPLDFMEEVEGETDTYHFSARYCYIYYIDVNNIVQASCKFTMGSDSYYHAGELQHSEGFDINNHPCYAMLVYPCSPSEDFVAPTISNPIDAPFLIASSSEFLVYSANEYQHREISEIDGAYNPYYNTNNTYNAIKVSALPFRAYESIYNAFYRNSQGVQPLLDGSNTPLYNKYLVNDGDGSDTFNYSLHERNWELDAYTSCMISPQQGNVPYVGITDISALGRMTVETPDGNTAEARLSDNGDGVEISNLRGETQEARAYALRAASSGFTIPEFREANALQRYLEMNIRKGYKYIDFIEGHFGKKPTYSEMDMPEFIGGFSQRISVNEVSQATGLDNGTLGAIAGQARAIGGSKHGVNHYFDDFGFIIGIMCIVPDNAYDSLLPKHFNLKEPLDMYFPEFSQLSYMPVTYEEIAPLQKKSGGELLTTTFGYQRPNHDLVWYPDTVHGLFRSADGIGNSVICRRWAVAPQLSDSFLRIKPEETDTIFNYTFGDNDIALGEIVFKISAKRPIPRLVVPSIS